jgi:type VI secretion system protein VasG
VQGPRAAARPRGLAKALREPLLKVFPPALLGRLVTIPYYPLLTNTVLPHISIEYLNRMAKGEEFRGIQLGASEGEFTYGFA